MLATKRAHIVLPSNLIEDIDKLVGKRGRSAFITEIARDEIMRRNQRNALRASAGAWKDEEHPELAQGSVQWVAQLRSESGARSERIMRQQNGD